MRIFAAGLAVFTCVFASGTPALAQDTDVDERRCLSADTDATARLAACSRLIDGAAYTDLSDYAKAHLNRALAYRQLHEDEKALAELNVALDYAPYSFPAYMARGSVLLALREPYRAIADFSVAIGLDPLDAAPYAKRGMALFAHREYAPALQDLENALHYDDKNVDARKTMAWILAAAPDRALRDGERALSLMTGLDAVTGPDRLILAAAQAEAGAAEEALATYGVIAADDPGAIPRFVAYLEKSGYLSAPLPSEWNSALQDAIRRCLQDGCRIGAPGA